MAEYLDKTGLTYLWSKIKVKFDAKADKTALNAKADKTALDAKADKTELDAKADKTELNEKADKTTADALGKRIDNLILSSGNESSAEVIDARTGYDGKAYKTLGTAIRTQANDIMEALWNKIDVVWTEGTYVVYSSGRIYSQRSYSASNYINVSNIDKLYYYSHQS